MDWTQTAAIIGANIAMMIGMLGTIIALYLNTDKKIEAIQAEMKDFHGRLCAIEERRQKFSEIRN